MLRLFYNNLKKKEIFESSFDLINHLIKCILIEIKINKDIIAIVEKTFLTYK